MTDPGYFGERTALHEGNPEQVRLDERTPVDSADALAERFEASRGQINDKQHLPDDVQDLIMSESGNIEAGADSTQAIEAYLTEQFSPATVTVEPLGGGLSGAKVFKVTIDNEGTVASRCLNFFAPSKNSPPKL